MVALMLSNHLKVDVVRAVTIIAIVVTFVVLNVVMASRARIESLRQFGVARHSRAVAP